MPASLTGWMSSPAIVTQPAVFGGPIELGAPLIPSNIISDASLLDLMEILASSFFVTLAFDSYESSLLYNFCCLFLAALKHPRTPPTNLSMDYPSRYSDHVAKRTRPIGIVDEVILPVNVFSVSFPGHGHSQAFNVVPDDLPKIVARTLNQGSSPMTMDFHPAQLTLLLSQALSNDATSFIVLMTYAFSFSAEVLFDQLTSGCFQNIYSVGTNVGKIALLEVGSLGSLYVFNASAGSSSE